MLVPISFYDEEKHYCAIGESELPPEAIEPYLNREIFTIKDGQVVFSYALLPILRKITESTQIKFNTSEIRSHYSKDVDNFDISDPLFLRDDQYEMIKTAIYKHYRGIVQCRTGMGKGEVIVYLAKTCLLPGNRLVLTNNNQVAVELELRFKKYGYELSDLNTMVLNPISFMNSNRCKDEEILKFLSEVTFIQIDELESVTSSLKELLKLTPKYKILYGYSASPEKVNGFDLSNADNIWKINDDALQVMSLAGTSLVYAAPTKPLTINRIKTKLPDEWFPRWVYGNESQGALVIKQKYSQSTLFKKKIIFKALDEIVLPNCQDILFIPYRFIEHGDQLYKHYEHSSRRVIQWDGKKIRSNIKELNEITLADIKRLSFAREFDILIASAVANRGVDFRNMKDIFLFIHSQYANLCQITGRCSRESNATPLNVWLLENELNNTPFYNQIQHARFNRLKSIYAGADVTYKMWEI